MRTREEKLSLWAIILNVRARRFSVFFCRKLIWSTPTIWKTHTHFFLVFDQVKFFVFLLLHNFWLLEVKMAVAVDRVWHTIWSLKLWKKSDVPFSRKWGSKILGVGHFVNFTPLGGSLPPIWPWEILGLWTLTKMFFVWGDRPEFGGVMGFGRFALWPTFSRILTCRFW